MVKYPWLDQAHATPREERVESKSSKFHAKLPEGCEPTRLVCFVVPPVILAGARNAARGARHELSEADRFGCFCIVGDRFFKLAARGHFY